MPADLVQSFVAGIESRAERHPSVTAIVSESHAELSYRQLDEAIDRALAFLQDYGLSFGDTVLALMPNSLETVLIFLACLKGGLRFAPLPCTATTSEIDVASLMVKPSLVLLADPVSKSLDSSLEGKIQTRRINVDGKLHWLSNELSRVKPGGGQLIITTSGSTATAKAILIDGDLLWSSGVAFAHFHRLDGTSPRFWNYLPMSYLGGLFNLTLIPLAAGGSFLIGEPFSGKTFLTFWPTVERFGIDTLWMVPSIVRGLCVLAERTKKPQNSHRVKTCFLGTAPIALSEKETFRQIFGIEMLENFALSETTFITSETSATLNYRTEGSVGSVLPYVEMTLNTIVDSDEHQSVKEISVKSPFLMIGYLRPDGSVDPARDANGFLRTGDLGSMVHGQLVVTGRTREIIKKGGYLILLNEIERLVESHHAVLEAVAIPTKHAFYGESYELLVQPYDSDMDKDSITKISAWLQEKLVKHKWPDRISIRKDFPRTSSGKVRKGVLRQEIAEKTDAQ